MQNLKSLQQALNDLTPAGAARSSWPCCVARWLVAYGLVWLVRGRTGSTGPGIWFGRRLYDGVLFPLAGIVGRRDRALGRSRTCCRSACCAWRCRS